MKNKSITYSIIYILLLSVLFFSCNKDTNDQLIELSDELKGVVSGRYNSSYYYQEYDPPLTFKYTWDYQNLYGTGLLFADLDINESSDLSLTMVKLNYDSIHLIIDHPNPYPFCKISFTRELQAGYTENNYTNLSGELSSISFISKLEIDHRIDFIENWTEQGLMWQLNEGYWGAPPFGDWHNSSEDSYIPIKNSNNKMGWIKIDCTNPRDLKILSFAIQK